MSALAIASLGYGFGAESIASLGFFDVLSAVTTGSRGRTTEYTTKRITIDQRLQQQILNEDAELLEILNVIMAMGVLER